MPRAGRRGDQHLRKGARPHEIVDAQRQRRLHVWRRRLHAAALSGRQQRDVTAAQYALHLTDPYSPAAQYCSRAALAGLDMQQEADTCKAQHRLKPKPRLGVDSFLVDAMPVVPLSSRCTLAAGVSKCCPAVVTLGGALTPGIGSRARLPAVVSHS